MAPTRSTRSYYFPGYRCLLLFSRVLTALPAQNTTGRITGQILDASGAVVDSAVATAEHVETHQSFTATTDKGGFYVIPNVPIGAYVVAAEHPGFGKQSQNGITVNVPTRPGRFKSCVCRVTGRHALAP